MNRPALARTLHQPSAATPHLPASPALHSLGLLNVLASTPASPSGRAPWIYGHLQRLAAKAGEKSGLTRRPAALLALALLAAAPAFAQAPEGAAGPGPALTILEVECVPNNDNGVVRATVEPEVGGADVRLYFRWDDHGPFYYVLMEAAGDGLYWATPPKPIDENHQVEVYGALVDPDGELLGSPSEPMIIPVTEDCDVELTPHERGMAQNLVVGETDEEQVGEDVWGFLCDGIISRVSPDGVLRADGICRRCIVAWWDKPDGLLPAAVLLGGGTVIVEASPSRP